MKPINQTNINLQIKEGAEKLREATTDRRYLSDVVNMVKKSNSKLAELKSELHELESQIILTQGNSLSSGNNGQGKLASGARRRRPSQQHAPPVG